jgi:predicted nuclease with TOPRIM domain
MPPDKGEGKGKKDKKKRKHQQMMDIPEVSLDYFPEEALENAKQLLNEEFKGVIQEKRELLSSTAGVYYENYDDVINAAAAATAEASAGDDDVATLQAEYNALQNAIKSLTKSCTKLEQKLQIQTGGYAQRSSSIIDSTLHSFAELQHSRIEECVYTRLRAHETRGITLRLERLKESVDRLEEEEMAKQKRYGELMHEKNRLLLKINGLGRKPPA